MYTDIWRIRAELSVTFEDRNSYDIQKIQYPDPVQLTFGITDP